MSDRKAVEEAKRDADKYAEAVLDGKEYALFDYYDAFALVDYYDVFALVALAYLQGQQAGIEWVRERVA